MRHLKNSRKFGRTSAHRRAMFENLATQLIQHEAIQTTVPRAKELRSFVDKLITLGKRGDLHARRLAAARLNQQIVDRSNATESKKHNDVLNKLFDDIAKRNMDRPGGYTRIIRLANRHGDNAPMVRIELVEKAEG